MKRCIVLGFILLSAVLQAQPLVVRIAAIEARSLPVIRLKVEVTKAGRALPQPGRASFALMENGLGVPIDVDCPDSAILNNVALVLDNSGSMTGQAFDSVKAGAHSVIDSLPANDAAAVYHFTNGGERVIGFTTDKAALHAAISGLMLGSGTPIYQTTDLALRELATRNGKKYCIVFTDGVDNSSIVTWEELVPLAQAAGIRIHAIGFGNSKLSDFILSTLAHETGGNYTRIYSPLLIADILRDIASDIVSPYCTISYTAASCTDSLRFLQLHGTLDGETAIDDTVFSAPSRRDTLTARIVAPDRMLPGDRAIVYVALDPGLHTGLQLTFSFELHFDPALLVASPLLPVTIGTMTQSAGARLAQVAPGVVQFSAELIPPATGSGNLIGVVLRHVAADSSRPVRLALENITVTAGCPNTVIVLPDTIEICQCVESLNYTIDTVAAIEPGKIMEFPLRIPLPASIMPKIVRAQLHFDPARLSLVGVADGDGEGWDLYIDRDHGTAQISVYTASVGPGIEPRLQFVATGERSPTRARFVVDSVTVFAACCMDAGTDSAGFWVDGLCEFLIRERNVVLIESVWPNPTADAVHVNVLFQGEEQDADLEFYDARGILLRSIRIETTETFDQEVLIPTQTLPPGRYTLLLRGTSSISKRSFLIVR